MQITTQDSWVQTGLRTREHQPASTMIRGYCVAGNPAIANGDRIIIEAC